MYDCFPCYRLNLSQSSSPGSAVKTGRGQKRKRVALSETVQEFGETSSGFSSSSSSSGNVVIDDIDTDGKYVKLHNTSDEVGLIELCVHSAKNSW